MRLSKLRIQNFRLFTDETIHFENYTCFVGPNGTGKSTVLTALNIFFRETANTATDMVNLGEEDFHNKNTKEPIRITVTFADLTPEAQEDLKDYYRQNELTVTAVAVFDPETKTAPVSQYGNRLGMAAFRPFFEKDKGGVSVKELNEVYEQLQGAFPDLPKATSKPAKIEALHTYEAAHPNDCILIESEDQFYGVSRGKNRLEKYIQWVFIPAVKDACTEQLEAKNTALGRLLDRTVRSQVSLDEPVLALKRETAEKYGAVLGEHREVLHTLQQSLRNKLQEWAHQDAGVTLDWQDADKAITISKPLAQVTGIEGAFEGEIARFGHGFQRSFLFALLQELSGTGPKEGPRLLLGCEEPELYQHPPQARYLASLLRRLSTQNSQIIVCTHSPYFVNGKDFENIRVALRLNGATKITAANFEQIADAIAQVSGEKPTKPGGIAAKIEQDMQSPLNEMFFASARVLVEGLEDVAYISSYITLLDKTDEFRRLGCHLIPAQGKSNMIQALAIVNQLKLPTFTVIDSDSDTKDDASGKRKQHEKDNVLILKLCGVDEASPFPAEDFWSDRVVMWKTKITDLPEQDIGEKELQQIREDVRRKCGIFVGNMHKNTLFISYVLAEAWEQGKKSPRLIRLAETILEFARKAHGINKKENS